MIKKKKPNPNPTQAVCMLPHRLCCDVASPTLKILQAISNMPYLPHAAEEGGWGCGVIPLGFNPAQLHISEADYTLQTGHLQILQHGIL